MKVIERVHNSRTGETSEVSWGNVIKDDLSIIGSVADILQQQRSREDGTNKSPFADRLTTVSITIEL